MDSFLQKVASQSMSFAIRSGIGVVSGFAMKKGSDYIKTLKGKDRQELTELWARLDAKIKIIAPAIDLVELVAARGNTTLEQAVTLTKSLRDEIQNLGLRFQNALSNNPKHKFRSEPKSLERDIKEMITRLEDAVPLINLALNTSGVDLSTALPDSVSPSRLLQASTLVTAGDQSYRDGECKQSLIGLNFTVTLYMLFAGHAHRKENISASDLTWQEVVRKCRLKLERVPIHQYMFNENTTEEEKAKTIRDKNAANEYCYNMVLIEDLDDGLAHDDEELASNGMGGPYGGVARAGIRTKIPIHQIGKLFYTSSGRLLGIDESNSPILLVNRQAHALPPRKLEERIHNTMDSDDEGETNELADQTSLSINAPDSTHNPQDLPRGLDPEWFAFQIYTENRNNFTESDLEDEYEEGINPISSSPPDISALSIDTSESHPYSPQDVNVKSHLSLLEYLIRLLSLQTSMQQPHLTVPDEILNLFLTNASGNLLNSSYRTRADEREAARRKIGFDPFAPSPRARRSVQGSPRVSLNAPSDTPPKKVSPQKSLPPATPSSRVSGFVYEDEDDEYDDDSSLPAMLSSPVVHQGSRRDMGPPFVADSAIGSMPYTPGARPSKWTPGGRFN